MLEFTSTSKKTLLTLFFLHLCFFLSAPSFAQSNPFEDIDQEQSPKTKNSGSSEDKNDFRETPYTQYGEFNEEEEEAEATLFYQYGRFFGVSFGVGIHGATGNRGLLWEGGFPLITLKIHYWFDFHFALQLEFYNASHFHDFTSSGSVTDVTMSRLGADLKYYFDTKDLSAALTFASPFLLVGGGAYTKSESASDITTATMNSFGFSAGAGLEFVLSHKKSYFVVEGKLNIVNFEDRFNTTYSSADGGIPDLTGMFYCFTGSFLFTF